MRPIPCLVYKDFQIAAHEDRILLLPRDIPTTADIAIFSATIILKHDELNLLGIKQLRIHCESEEDKYRVSRKFYHVFRSWSTIIFVMGDETASEIQGRVKEHGDKVAMLDDAQEGVGRDRVMDAVRSLHAKPVIINVLPLIVGVAAISTVANYDFHLDQNYHPDPLSYPYRSGRTERLERGGVPICLAHDTNTMYERKL
ncbi:hypothetical protein HOY80DRAFT_1043198 [Tuber brumale]|nr:hypothetical protein HOY80DRAFT_1043198 [Tuber brumale]